MYSSATASYSASAVCAAKLLAHGKQSVTDKKMAEGSFITKEGSVRAKVDNLCALPKISG
jgi:hypothetical protein